MRTLRLSLLVLSLLIPACREEGAPVLSAEPSLDDLVIQNCYIVAAAADSFAAQGGQFLDYPNQVSDLLPFLPNGELLVNPYTGLATEPSDGWAVSEGQTGYRPIFAGLNVGCHVTGFGESEEILHLVKPANFDSLVIVNCHIVADAAEAYAAQYGQYPSGYQATLPFLPNGEMLANPYSGAWSEPTNGAAVNKGGTGYQAFESGGIVVGYNITGFGEFNLIYQISVDP